MVKKKISSGSWTFGKNIPLSFDDHIKRSIPGYDVSLNLITELSTYFLTDNSICYDVGFSTGKLISNIYEINKGKKIKLIGVEPEKKMVNFFKKTKIYRKSNNIKIINKNIENIRIENCDLIISHYTLQFIRQNLRIEILKKFYDNLNLGGAFIFFEKVHGNNSRFEKIFSDLLTDFKLKNNFSDEEIVNKNKAIRGVLNPLSINENLALLKRAGFKKLQVIYHNINFAGILAIK